MSIVLTSAGDNPTPADWGIRMSVTPSRSTSVRPRLLAALLAGFLALGGSLVSVTAAHAATGYVGTSNPYVEEYFDTRSGNRTLPLMTGGVAYSAQLKGPQFGGESTYKWSISDGSLPEGISLSPEGTYSSTATFSGTPEAGPFSFTVSLFDGEGSMELVFSGTVESGKTPTVTTLSVPEFAPYSALTLSATVVGTPSGTPTGSVEFRIGSEVIGTATLVAGVAETSAVFALADVGSAKTVTAYYLGDEDFSTSNSSGGDVVLYSRDARGTVLWNGVPVAGATVQLLVQGEVLEVADSDTSDEFGGYLLTAPTPQHDFELAPVYLIRATLPDSTVLHYAAGEFNVSDLDDAERVGMLGWGIDLEVLRGTPPAWSDQSVTDGRVGNSYSDGVSVTSRNTDVEFAVTAGSLPPGLSLDGGTGAITGTPTEEGVSTFTITADNGFGVVSKALSITILRAGIPPTWDDEELPEFRVSVAVTDGVSAEGDPTIVYSVTEGTLPAGLSLNSATGAITGTPTTEGAYTFVITAENEFGSIEAEFTGEVGAKPDLGLKLDFKAGTRIEDAKSTISAEGLLVGSEYVLTLHSKPRELYTGTVDSTGGFTWQVAIPKDTPAGSHRLVLTGTAADGRAMSDTAWFSLGADGRIIAISYSGPVGGGLANTGAEPLNTGIPGLVLVLLGVAAVIVARRAELSPRLR